MATELGDEAPLWAASPDGWALARRLWKNALIGIPFTAFAIFWTWTAAGGFSDRKGHSAPAFFILWGLMFVGFGLATLLSPLFPAWKARRTYYVLTRDRAIVFEQVWRPEIRSFPRAALGGYERVSRGGRGGDIVFQRTIERRGRGTRTSEVGFLGLRDFAEAEEAIRCILGAEARGR